MEGIVVEIEPDDHRQAQADKGERTLRCVDEFQNAGHDNGVAPQDKLRDCPRQAQAKASARRTIVKSSAANPENYGRSDAPSLPRNEPRPDCYEVVTVCGRL